MPVFTLAHPVALWLVPAVTLLLLLMRRLPTREQRVGTFALWRAGSASPTTTFGRRWPRRLPPMAWAWLTALLLVLAIAAPSVSWRAVHAVVIVDVSPSMTARANEGDPIHTRLDEARQVASEWRSRWSWWTPVRIISAGPVPRDLGRARSAAGVRRLLSAIRASDGRGDLSAALGQREHDIPTLVLTDRPRPSTLPDAVMWRTVGAPVENLAVTALSVRARPDQPSVSELVVTVANEGTRARTTAIRLSSGQDGVAPQPLQVPPGEATSASLAVTSPHVPTVFEVALDGTDAYASDDRRQVSVLPPHQTSVRVLGTASSIARAVTAARWLRPWTAADPEPPAVVICADCDAAPRAAPRSGVVWMPRATSSALPAQPVRMVGAPHDALDGVDLTGLVLAPAQPSVERTPDTQILAVAGQTPLVLVRARDGARQVTLNIRDDDAGLTRAVLFPLLMRAVLQWVSRLDAQRTTLDAGDALHWPAPAPNGSAARLIGPDGHMVPLSTVGHEIVSAPLETAGVYRLHDCRVEVPIVVTRATGVAPAAPALRDTPVGPQRSAPVALARGLLGLAAALLLWRAWSRWRAGAPPVTLLVTAATVCAAIVWPRVGWREAPRSTVFALDASSSVALRTRRASVAAISRGLSAARTTDRAGVVTFGADVHVARDLASPAPLPHLEPAVDGWGTNIGLALQRAAALLPPDGDRRIVLLSDGADTGAHTREAAAALHEAGVAVDTVPLAASTSVPLLRGLSAPADVGLGRPVALMATIQGPATTSVTTRFFRDGTTLADVTAVTDPSGAALVRATDPSPTAGTHHYAAAVVDGLYVGASRATAVVVRGAPSVLLVTSQARPAVAPWVSLPSSVQTSSATLPTDPAALTPFDVVVLAADATASLSDPQLTALRHHVEHAGAGLVLMGPPAQLDARAPDASPLTPVLPITTAAARDDEPSRSMAVVIDRSGSMAAPVAGMEKLAFTRRAVEQVARALTARDRLSVIAAGPTPAVVIPLGPPPAPEALSAPLRALTASGGTRLAPAVDRALRVLEGPTDAAGHVLLVSDGRTSAADAAQLLTLARAARVPISTIAVGDDADRALLASVATPPRGHAFEARDLRDLPAVMARAVRTATEAAATDGATLALTTGHPALPWAAGRALFTVNAHTRAELVSDAAAVLTAGPTDPLLAVRQAGLGRVAVWTGSARGASGVWPALFTWVARSQGDPRLALRLTRRDDCDALQVETEIDNGGWLTFSQITAAVTGTDGHQIVTPLAMQVPGRYSACLPPTVDDTGLRTVTVTGVRPDGETLRVTRTLTAPPVLAEDTVPPSDDLLADLAAATGGRLLTDPAAVWEAQRATARRDVTGAAAGTALLLLLGDLAARRRPRSS